MKTTFLDLENIGIVHIYKHSELVFRIITKGGDLWEYNPITKAIDLIR